MNGRAPARLRFNSQLAINEPGAFLHRNQTDAAVLLDRCRFESFPFIADNQMRPAVGLPYTDATVPNPAVLRRVVQRLLQNSKQAQ